MTPGLTLLLIAIAQFVAMVALGVRALRSVSDGRRAFPAPGPPPADLRGIELREWNDPDVYRQRIAFKAANAVLAASPHSAASIIENPVLPDAVFAKGYYGGHPVQILVGRYERYDSHRGTST